MSDGHATLSDAVSLGAAAARALGRAMSREDDPGGRSAEERAYPEFARGALKLDAPLSLADRPALSPEDAAYAEFVGTLGITAHEDDLDEAQLATWVTQAAGCPAGSRRTSGRRRQGSVAA